ncbi:hypothetical protein COO60DRAFT_1462708 [Scenedesmus sp. NREL 46B-D3]|nr:hypothetical protein COO60DRAFT_1462708 [Scenedesmus sp. NREL 46B-D3]
MPSRVASACRARCHGPTAGAIQSGSHPNAGDCSLLKAVVSASGQGAAALLNTPFGAQPHKAVWRSRSVRNKLESYAILQLKGQSHRDVTVQVTFQSPATTPQQLRLLHAPAVNCAFKPLPVQLHITAGDAQQLQHSLSVAPHVHVQRYLKLEMQGLAVPSTAGALHAVCWLDVVQFSALAAAAAATATQLPVPAPLLDSPTGTMAAAVAAADVYADGREGPQDLLLQELAAQSLLDIQAFTAASKAAAHLRAPVEANASGGRNASKYEQLLKSQYGGAPAVRATQSRLALRKSASAAGPQQQQQQRQRLPECSSEPALSSLRLVDLAAEGSFGLRPAARQLYGSSAAPGLPMPVLQPQLLTPQSAEPMHRQLGRSRTAADAAGGGGAVGSRFAGAGTARRPGSTPPGLGMVSPKSSTKQQLREQRHTQQEQLQGIGQWQGRRLDHDASQQLWQEHSDQELPVMSVACLPGPCNEPVLNAAVASSSPMGRRQQAPVHSRLQQKGQQAQQQMVLKATVVAQMKVMAAARWSHSALLAASWAWCGRTQDVSVTNTTLRWQRTVQAAGIAAAAQRSPTPSTAGMLDGLGHSAGHSAAAAAAAAARAGVGSASSSCASAAGVAGEPLTVEVSMNDLGVGGDQHRPPGGTRVSKDQSPSKSPAKDAPPARFRGSKAGGWAEAAATSADKQLDAAAGAPAAAGASGQLLTAGRRVCSTGSGGGAVPGAAAGDGLSGLSPGGAATARVGRMRHRRAKSDMPEYYPMSPLESPLHTAMPADDPDACRHVLAALMAPEQGAGSTAAVAGRPAAQQLGLQLCMLETPALLAASAETLDSQPGDYGQGSWRQQQERELGGPEKSRLSQDSQQDAVMQSQGALLGPGPGSNSCADSAAAEPEAGGDGGALASSGAAGRQERRAQPATAAAAGARPPAAAADFRRSSHLLAGLAQGLWPLDACSVDSTAGSSATGAVSHSGAAAVWWARGGGGAGGLRCSTGSLGPEVALAHQLAAGVEHLAASLDVTGPQVGRLGAWALQMTQELLLQQLLAQPDDQCHARTASAAGTAGQHSGRTASSQRQQREPGPGPQATAGAPENQPQLGPLLAGRLAALAAMRRLRRSSVGESPDVPATSAHAVSSSRRGMLGSASNSQLVSVLAAVGPAAGHAAAAPAGLGIEGEAVLRASQSSSAGASPAGAGARVMAAPGSSRTAAGLAGAERQQHQQQQGQGPLASQPSAQRWHQQQPGRRRPSVGAGSSWAGAAASTGSAQHTSHSRGSHLSHQHSRSMQQAPGEQPPVVVQRLLCSERSEGSDEVTGCASGTSAGGSVLSHRSSSSGRG